MKKTFRKGLHVLYAATLLLYATSLHGQTAKWGSQAVYNTDDQTTNDVAVDGNGDSYTVGFFKGGNINFFNTVTGITKTNAGGFDGFLARYDRATGEAVWGVTMGGVNNDYTAAVTTYPEGSDYVIYVCGYYTGSMTFNSSDGVTTTVLTSPANKLQDAYIAKYNSSGIVQWAYSMISSSNDAAYDIVAINSGGIGAAIYVCGAYGTNITFDGQSSPLAKNTLVPAGNDAFLVRYVDDITTPTVDPVWARGLGTTGGSDAYYAVAADANGNVVVTGIMRNTIAKFDVSGGALDSIAASGSAEAVAIYYNASGTRVWSQHYGSTAAVIDAGTAAAMDLNGDAYLGGYYSGNGIINGVTHTNLGTGQDSYILKVSAAGAVQWVQTGGTANTDDVISSLAVDNCGKHLYAAGQYNGNFSFSGFTFAPYNTGAPNIDGVFMTLNASTGAGISGDGIQMGGSSGIDNRNAVAVNTLEDVYVAGSFASQDWYFGVNNNFANVDNPTNGHTDGYLYRWDNINFPALATSVSGTTAHRGVGVDDCTIYAGGELTGGATFGSTSLNSTIVTDVTTYASKDAYFTACDKYGNYTSFVKTVLGKSNELMRDQYVDASGNNYFCGDASIFNTPHTINTDVLFNNSATFNITGGSSGWVCKTNSSGAVQWANWINGNAAGKYVTGYGVTTDASGNVYFCGSFNGTVTFSNASGGSTINKTNTGPTDMFIAKYDGSNGNLLWVQTIAATTYLTATAITTSGSDYYATGFFKGNTTIGSNGLTSTGSYYNTFAMRGNASTGAATYSLRGGNTTSDDWGNDIIALSSSAVYVAGSIGTSTAMLARINLSTSIPTWTWTRTNSSGTATGYRVETYNGFIYLGGTCTGGTLTFGSLSTGTGAYVARYENGGTIQCMSAYGGKDLYGLAAMPGMLNADGGDNLVIAGGATAYIHSMGLTNCIFTERHGMLINDAVINNKPSIDNSLVTSSVYPNPANGSTIFELNDNYDLSKNPGSLVITDMAGRVVKQIDNIVTQFTTIETTELANGIYQYQFVSNGQVMNVGKIAVQH